MALHEELVHQGDFLFRHRSYLPLVGVALYALALVVEDLVWGGVAGVSWEPETTAIALAGCGLFVAVRWLRKKTRVLKVDGR